MNSKPERLFRILSGFDYLSDKERRDLAFHLTDWESELRVFLDALDGKLADDKACKAIRSFLSHAPEHIAAAAKILLDLDIEDTFELGVRGSND